MPEPSIAIPKARSEITITTIRPTHITFLSDAFFLIEVLYTSDANAEDAARSWESAVDILAAMIAEMTTPPMKTGKTLRAISTKTRFLLSSIESPRYFLATMATTDAIRRIRVVQEIPIQRDFFISFSDLIEIYRTMMCGIPKYPRPQPRPVSISETLFQSNLPLERKL